MLSKTKATSLQPYKTNNLVAAPVINNLDVLQLSLAIWNVSHNGSSMQTLYAQMACRGHSPALKLNTMQIDELLTYSAERLPHQPPRAVHTIGQPQLAWMVGTANKV